LVNNYGAEKVHIKFRRGAETTGDKQSKQQENLPQSLKKYYLEITKNGLFLEEVHVFK